jgi:predicted ATP-grasp superfamily ATP-dependent carboligase
MFQNLSANHRESIRHYFIKQLHNNTWSVVYVDLQVIIPVVICYTGSSRLRQRVYDMEMFTVLRYQALIMAAEVVSEAFNTIFSLFPQKLNFPRIVC